MGQKTISEAVIRRLPRYYRYLDDLKRSGVERISSGELSKMMQVTASQIRQDLNHFGGFGQQGYGYNVDYLYSEIGRILGLYREYNLIIIGAGHLGQALANYTNFERIGFHVRALFDIDPKLIGSRIRNVPVYSTDELSAYLKENRTDIAAITLPKDAAAQMAGQLAEAGIRGIWNFAHIDLHLPGDCIVENVHLSESLMRLSYLLDHQETEKSEE